jgi:hypothetical protein
VTDLKQCTAQWMTHDAKTAKTTEPREVRVDADGLVHEMLVKLRPPESIVVGASEAWFSPAVCSGRCAKCYRTFLGPRFVREDRVVCERCKKRIDRSST